MLSYQASSDITDVTQSCCLHGPCYLTSVTSSARFPYLIPRGRFRHKCKISLATVVLCHGNCVCGDKMRRSEPTAPINTLRYLATRSVWRKCSLQAKRIQANCPHPPLPLRPHGLIHRGDAVMCISRRHSEGVMEKKKEKKKQASFKKLNRNSWRVVNKWQITGFSVFVLKDQLPRKWELMEREVVVSDTVKGESGGYSELFTMKRLKATFVFSVLSDVPSLSLVFSPKSINS